MKAPKVVSDNLKHVTFYVLRPVEAIYRFAGSDSSRFGYQASPWWLREREFEGLLARAAAGRLGLGMQARFDLAVLQSWGNRMDILVRATVRRQLDAWMGLPRTQRETAPNGMTVTMPGRQQIQQVYICGLTDASGMLSTLGRTALSIEETVPLKTAQLWSLPNKR